MKIKVIVFDMMVPIALAAKGNTWSWFKDRQIFFCKIYNTTIPEALPSVRSFLDASAAKEYLRTLGIAPQETLFVSDNQTAIHNAKTIHGFLTLAVPQARATNFTDHSTTSVPDSNDLAGCVNLLESREKAGGR